MVIFVEKINGYYFLKVRVGGMTVTKALMDADKTIDEIKKLPKADKGMVFVQFDNDNSHEE